MLVDKTAPQHVLGALGCRRGLVPADDDRAGPYQGTKGPHFGGHSILREDQGSVRLIDHKVSAARQRGGKATGGDTRVTQTEPCG